VTSTSEKRNKKTLLAGLGNTLLGDEGIGVRIIEILEKEGKMPGHIHLLDGGTAGYTLIDCMKDFERVILVDAVRGGGKPGTIYLFSFDDIINKPELKLSGHQIGLPEVLLLAKRLGELPETILIGIEPENMAYGEELSLTAKKAVKQAIEAIESIL